MASHRHATPRRMMFVDIENLCGGARQVGSAYPVVRSHLVSALGLEESVATVIGAGRQVRVEVPMLPIEWPARFVFGCGIDGADLALIDAMREEPMARRSTEVVIASGDGIFADSASWLSSQGVAVTVASSAHSLSRRLRVVATNVVELPQLNPIGLAAA